LPDSPIGKSFELNKVENEPVSYNEKMYSNIVRSVLSNDITQLLAINCFCSGSQDPYWKFKLLMERYEFFEHMPFTIDRGCNSLLDETIAFYKESAFGKSIFLKQKNNMKLI